MDLGLYTQVIRRHRLLVTVGIAVTVALAVLSFVRISTDGIRYRSPEVWSNEATLVLSQPGFPEWRSTTSAEQTQRLASLVDLYVALVTSDSMLAALEKQELIEESGTADAEGPISASAVPSPTNGAPTPLMKITGRGASAGAATKLTIGATDTFIRILLSRQKAADIPPNERVEVRTVKRSGEPMLAVPRSKTSAIIILLAGLTATVAAAFIRENLRQTADGRAGETEMAIVPDDSPSETTVPELDSAVGRPASALSDAREGPADEEHRIRAVGRTRWTPRSSR